MSFSNIRSRLHRRKRDDRPLLDNGPVPDDTFYDVAEGHRDSLTAGFDDDHEKRVYEEHLANLQEQLVSLMIENQTLASELKNYKDNETNEKLREELLSEKNKSQALEVQLRRSMRKRPGSSQGASGDGASPGTPPDRQPGRPPPAPGHHHHHAGSMHPDVVPEVAVEAVEEPGRSKLDQAWEGAVDRLYDLFEDLGEITRPEVAQEVPVEPLTVKTLKENLKRFKVAVKPYTDTLKGFYNIVSWKSPSYTIIVFLVYMYSVMRGWFVPLLFFMAALRVAVNFLHFKNFKFKFAYFDPGEAEPETEDTLGISDRFNLVLQVATKVQNGLGTAADSLEKLKNLFTWRHPEGTRRVLSMLIMGFVMSALLPTPYFWKFLGLCIGVKIFVTNFVYNKYPRLKRKYDSGAKLWKELPTDSQYDRNYVRAEMNKYIVVPRDSSEREQVLNSQSSESSESEEDDDSIDFRQLFALPPSERPLRGWGRGKRTVLIGKERSLVTLLTRKRGKLYLTKSFLCFEREKCASPRNLVIPLQDIVTIDKIKVNQRLPGRGMSIQIVMSSDGKDNVLLFGGIIGREDVIQSIKAASDIVKRQGRYIRSSGSLGSMSTGSGGSTPMQNFTFAAYYEDSE